MFSFAQDKFAQDIKRLAQLTRKTAPEILKQAARAVVADACALTPPTGKTPLGAAGGKRTLASLPGNSKEAEKQGKDAIARDARSLFRPIDSLRLANEDTKLGQNLRRLLRAGRFVELQELLRKLGVHVADIQHDASVGTLDFYRDARGRIRRKGTRARFVLVRNERSIARVIRVKQALVGTAKSGWRAAAAMVGLRLPAWISKHGGTGIASASNSPDKPEFTVGNAVRYIQRAGREEKIMERAIGNVRRNLPLQIEAILKRKARGAGFRAK
jgi:hypothetical protein